MGEVSFPSKNGRGSTRRLDLESLPNSQLRVSKPQDRLLPYNRMDRAGGDVMVGIREDFANNSRGLMRAETMSQPFGVAKVLAAVEDESAVTEIRLERIECGRARWSIILTGATMRNTPPNPRRLHTVHTRHIRSRMKRQPARILTVS
jgi:hypothetical protein